MGAGRLIGARYRLESVIGSGGTGQVWRAHDTVLDRTVAVKQLRPGQDALTRERLRVEARLAGALQHPGIAQIFDYGEETGDGGEVRPYLVMQYVEGATLRAVLRERRTLPPAEVMELVAQVAAALQAAHAEGIVHRDLKPGNILVTPDGRAVLVDFGIARSPDLEPLTLTGAIVGTADYISPEQASGQSASARSDLYSLGLIAYECLTGLKPFRRENQLATVVAHLNDELPPMDPTVPPEVRDLVLDMVEKRPEDRPADADEVARRAAALAVDDEVARRAAALAVDDEATTRAAAVPARRRTPWLVLHRRASLAVVALVSIVVVGVAFLVVRPESGAVPKLPDVPRHSSPAEPTPTTELAAVQTPKPTPTPAATVSTPEPARKAAVKPKPAAEPSSQGAAETGSPGETGSEGEPESKGKTKDGVKDKGKGEGKGKSKSGGPGKG